MDIRLSWKNSGSRKIPDFVSVTVIQRCFMLAGTRDGKSWGFYFDDQKESLQKYFELTREEHSALMRGQSQGKVIVFHDDEKPTLEDPPPPTTEELATREIRELKRFLEDTDYVVIKISEGAAKSQEYKETIKKRQKARNRINELQEELAAIGA